MVFRIFKKFCIKHSQIVFSTTDFITVSNKEKVAIELDFISAI